MIRACVVTCVFVSYGLALSSQGAETGYASFPLQAKKILFLGDSITHAGQYIARIETQLRIKQVDPLPEIINLGLGSETCSGLSEPDHPFPRPDVHERLDRALAKIQPDVVVVCYGMNDGIYHPFSEERFQAYRDGIDRLIEKVHASGAKLILMTPPPLRSATTSRHGEAQAGRRREVCLFCDVRELRRRAGSIWRMDN